MRLFRAAWVLPIDGAPVRHGWVQTDAGRIVAWEHASAAASADAGSASSPEVGEWDDAIVLPGLVNAHTHFELSHLRGVVGPAPNFVAWVRTLLAARRQDGPSREAEIQRGIAGAIDEAVRTGTAVVGDISNTLDTVDPLRASPLAGVVFHELIGFSTADPAGVVRAARERHRAWSGEHAIRVSLAAHAPYSVSPGLFEAIAQAVPEGPVSVHLAESPEETRFTATGEGPWRALLEELGAWNPSWTPPGCGPVEYLDRIGFLRPNALVTHGVQMTPDDLDLVRRRGVTLVACPRSNVHTGVGVPPVQSFYDSGVRVAVGTDSLTSAPDLNMFSELQALRAIAPGVPAAKLIESATREGAAALGCRSRFGTIAPGMSDRLIAVSGGRTLATAGDVEEYLVSGIGADRVAWLGAGRTD